jgi:hypothetical protein
MVNPVESKTGEGNKTSPLDRALVSGHGLISLNSRGGSGKYTPAPDRTGQHTPRAIILQATTIAVSIIVFSIFINLVSCFVEVILF